MSTQIIRAIPQWAGPGNGDRYYDIGKMPWKQQTAFKDELGQLGYYVQTITLEDTMPVMVGAQIRREIEEQQAKDV